MFTVLSQANTSELIKEIKSRIDAGFGPQGTPLMVSRGELNSLMDSMEVYLINQYAQDVGMYERDD
jgi:Zn-finger nucleic acid-binding protein